MAAGLVTEGRVALQAAARAYGSRRLHQRQAEAELALARTPPARRTRRRPRPRPGGAARRFRRTRRPAWRVRADAVALAAEVELGRAGPALVDARPTRLAAELHGQGLRRPAAASSGCTRPGCWSAAATATPPGERLSGLRVGAGSPLGRAPARPRRAGRARRAPGPPPAAPAPRPRGPRRPARVAEHVRQPRPADHGGRAGRAPRRPRAGARGRRRGRPEVLFEWSERARMLASRVQPVRPPADRRSWPPTWPSCAASQARGRRRRPPRPRRGRAAPARPRARVAAPGVG